MARYEGILWEDYQIFNVDTIGQNKIKGVSEMVSWFIYTLQKVIDSISEVNSKLKPSFLTPIWILKLVLWSRPTQDWVKTKTRAHKDQDKTKTLRGWDRVMIKTKEGQDQVQNRYWTES